MLNKPTTEKKERLYERGNSVSGEDFYRNCEKVITVKDPIDREQEARIFNEGIPSRFNILKNGDIQDINVIVKSSDFCEASPRSSRVETNYDEVNTVTSLSRHEESILKGRDSSFAGNGSLVIDRPIKNQANDIVPLPTRANASSVPVMDTIKAYESRNGGGAASVAKTTDQKKDVTLGAWGIVAIVVFALIVIAGITFIAINTAVINGLNADIATLQVQASSLGEQVVALQEEIKSATALETIIEWAKGVGMFR